MPNRRHEGGALGTDAALCPHCGETLGGVVAAGWSVGDGDSDLCPTCGVDRSAPNAVCEAPPGLVESAGLYCPLCVGHGVDEGRGASLPHACVGPEGSHASEGGQAGMVAPRHDEDGSCPECGGVSGEVFLEGILRAISEGCANQRKRGPL